jgi:hypothetical protein
MSDLASELRRQAAICRQAATVPTNGDSRADSELLVLAEEFERQADAVDEAERSRSERRSLH